MGDPLASSSLDRAPSGAFDRVPGGRSSVAALLALLVALPCLIFEPASTDLAAQTFRAELWEREGWVLWSEAWYSGFLVPGYSLLYPPLGALFGPQLVGAASAVLAATCFASICTRTLPGRGADIAALWFALGISAMLYTGRLTFMLGLAFGVAAVLAAVTALEVADRSRGRGRAIALAAAFLLAAASSFAAPLAGLFTGIAAAALVLSRKPAEGLAVGVGAGIALLAMIVAFPTGGEQPFGWTSLWAVAAFIAIGLALPVWRERPELRVLWLGLVVYAAIVVVAFVVATPIGNNAPRLGALLAGPLAALILFDRRPVLLLLLAAPLLWWQLGAPVRDFAKGSGDPSTERAFYQPLLAELDRISEQQQGLPFRVEVPISENRFEAAYVADRYPLARGWMRQLEYEDIEALHSGEELSASGYRRWLERHGVSYVALNDARRDYLSEPEAELLGEGDLPYLRELPIAGEHWRLWRVEQPAGSGAGAPLALGGAVVEELGPDRFTVRAPGPGEYELRIDYSPYFEVRSRSACLRDGGRESTILEVGENAPGPLTVEVEATLSGDGLLGRERVC